MEFLKDYDCAIQFHPVKVNVVTDALSRKSSDSLVHISNERRPLIQELHRLMNLRLILDISDESALLTHFRVRSNL